jgi:hypothetical protein
MGALTQLLLVLVIEPIQARRRRRDRVLAPIGQRVFDRLIESAQHLSGDILCIGRACTVAGEY